MKRIIIGLTFGILLFLEAGLLVVNLATANPVGSDRQYLPELIIKGDGAIVLRQGVWPFEESQAPEFINRTGNVYTLTADVDGYSVRIDCSNIVFDGGGHTIHASLGFINSGLRLIDVTEVTVKNLEVKGGNPTSIYLAGSNCLITSVKTEGDLRLRPDSNYNIIFGNNVNIHIGGRFNQIEKNNITGIYLTSVSLSNHFFKNNFLASNLTTSLYHTPQFWDNGSLGNYWSDYLTKYPNASEVGNTGIGNTPYVIDENNVDYYPLMYPYDIENDTIAFPKPEPQPEPEPFLTAPVAAASAASIGLIGVGVLVYFRKRKRQAPAAS